MNQPVFGRRDKKEIAAERGSVVRAHAEYKKEKRVSMIEKIMTWLSYYTLVFATVAAFTPDSAVAAVLGVGQIVGVDLHPAS